MVSIHALHILAIGIYFIITSQIAPFQEHVLSFMLIIGIILLILGIIFRIIKVVGMKIKKAVTSNEKYRQKIPVPTNYYFTYFLIGLAFISTSYGYVTMSST